MPRASPRSKEGGGSMSPGGTVGVGHRFDQWDELGGSTGVQFPREAGRSPPTGVPTQS